jgi:transposase
MGRVGESIVAISAEERAAVEAELRRTALPARVRERLEMVKAVALGHDLAGSAAWSGRSVRTVRRWLGRFRAGGVAALADAPRAGRPARADAAYLRALEAAVDAGPRAHGLEFDVWTSDRLSAYLAERTGVRIAPSWLRTLLGRQDFVCGRPKHALGHLQDPAEEAAFEAALAEAGGENGGRTGPVRAAPPG